MRVGCPSWFIALLLSLALLIALSRCEEEQDHYKVLGVEKTATVKQIRKAFKQLALKYHPDKVRDQSKKKAAEEKFFKITQAYETLSDPEKRKLYDMQRSANPNPFTSGFGGHHGGHGSHGSHRSHGSHGSQGFNFDSMFFENVGGHRQFHFGQDFPGNFFSFDNLFPEDHHPFFEDHSFGDGSSFFGSHFGRGHHGNHRHSHQTHQRHVHEAHFARPSSQFSNRHGNEQRGHGGAFGGHHFSHSGHQTCHMVTEKIGNMVTTHMQCS